MEELIAKLFTSQNIIQGGGILIAASSMYVIVMVIKIIINLKAESDARITALTKESFDIIRDNSKSNMKLAEALGRHDTKIEHILNHSHRGAQNCDMKQSVL